MTARREHLVVNIDALQEIHYTGIPNVIAEICTRLVEEDWLKRTHSWGIAGSTPTAYAAVSPSGAAGACATLPGHSSLRRQCSPCCRRAAR